MGFKGWSPLVHACCMVGAACGVSLFLIQGLLESGPWRYVLLALSVLAFALFALFGFLLLRWVFTDEGG